MNIIEKMNLQGKKALVTGGSRGIGYSIAMALAEAGADVAITGTKLPSVEEAADRIYQATGQEIVALCADVTVPEDVENMVSTVVQKFGQIDAAFCNAGVCMNVPAEEMSLEQWMTVVQTNLTGVFLTAQAVGKVMLHQGKGSIVNTASMAGHIIPTPQPQCAYNASKAGVIQLTKSLAVEWATRGVRVNCISPGYIGTELVLSSPTLEPLVKQWNELSPLHRLGSPEELQGVAVYLASDASSFTTGSDFVVDGAFTAI